MKKLKASVIMLTYNREALVGRAIESILNQTFRQFEFIIINNGSKDKSGEIAEAYAAKDSRITVMHRKGGNIGSGRNAGLNIAKGDYIAFIDDDDYAEADFLELLYDTAEKNGADISICGATGGKYEDILIMDGEQAVIELMWRRRFNMAFPTKLFRRKLVESLRFPEEGKYDDIALMYKLLAAAKKVVYNGLPKYTFYRHDNNNSAWTTNHSLLTSETLNEYLKAYRDRTIWLSELFPKSKGAFEYFEWSFMISMVEKIERLKIKGCEEQLKEMKNTLSINREQFLKCGLILDFEKEWLNEYVLSR